MKRAIVATLGWLGWLGIWPVSAAEKPVLFVEQPIVLGALEDRGYDFPGLFGVTGRSDLASLYEKSPAYAAMVDLISADLASLRSEIKEGGRSLQEFTGAETGRVMDMRWLKSSAARLRLVGVVNRLDRRDFHDLRNEPGCGEVRLIFRLAYSFRKDGEGKILSSRMPFNFNAVYDVLPDPAGGCATRAKDWQAADRQAIGAALLERGPLDWRKLRFRQLELNAQMVRFPSGQEPQFGGQAVYLMRIFGISGDDIAELPLENTPDLDALAADPALKAELAAYVRDNTRAIDEGVYLIPDHLSARKVISYSTFGGARQVNHPFTPLYSPRDFASVDFSGNRLVRSPEALLARLDNGTCQGCHQSGATAGFHFIGLDDKLTSPLNRIEVGISPHFHAELPRRAAWLDAMVEGRDPNRFRPLSFAPPAVWNDIDIAYENADLAQPCLTEPDAARFGETWQCGAGTVCTSLASVDQNRIALAQCLPPPKAQMASGLPCLQGEVTSGTPQPFMDRYPLTQFTAFAAKASPFDYTCRPPRIGVPGGMAYRQCDEKDRAFVAFKAGAPMPAEICGLTGGKKFDECVSTGKFDQCLAGAVQRGNRAACSAEHFCRDDYICQAFPPDVPNVDRIKNVGFCSPTYFMFQMRIDNHTTPWKSRRRAVYRSVEAKDGEDQW